MIAMYGEGMDSVRAFGKMQGLVTDEMGGEVTDRKIYRIEFQQAHATEIAYIGGNYLGRKVVAILEGDKNFFICHHPPEDETTRSGRAWVFGIHKDASVKLKDYSPATRVL